MKRSTLYLILTILDIILIIMWPIALACAAYPKWLAFLAGALWCSDWYDVSRHIDGYVLSKAKEEPSND